jgi:hypothetical protein
MALDKEDLKNIGDLVEVLLEQKLAGIKLSVAGLEHSNRIIGSRLDDLEQTNRIIRSTPHRPDLVRHSHRAVRADSVSGPIYR